MKFTIKNQTNDRLIALEFITLHKAKEWIKNRGITNIVYTIYESTPIETYRKECITHINLVKEAV